MEINVLGELAAGRARGFLCFMAHGGKIRWLLGPDECPPEGKRDWMSKLQGFFNNPHFPNFGRHSGYGER